MVSSVVSFDQLHSKRFLVFRNPGYTRIVTANSANIKHSPIDCKKLKKLCQNICVGLHVIIIIVIASCAWWNLLKAKEKYGQRTLGCQLKCFNFGSGI